MHQQLLHRGPLRHILLQSKLQKGLELVTPPPRLLQRGRRTRVDLQQRLQRRVPEVRRLALGHLQRRDARAPHVNRHTVASTLNQLGSHPEGRPHHRLPLVFLRLRKRALSRSRADAPRSRSRPASRVPANRGGCYHS